MMNLFYACNKLKLNPSKSHFCISGSKAQIAEISQSSLRLVVAVPLAVDIFVNVSLDSKRLKKG